MTTYQEYEDHILHKHLGVRCGDVIELRLTSGQLTETPAVTTNRCIDLFVHGLGLFPNALAVEPTHFEALPARAIDICLGNEETGEEGDPAIGGVAEEIDATTIPVKIPYLSDSSLAPGTVAARYHVARCATCQVSASLVEVMQNHNFMVTDRADGIITMTRVDTEEQSEKAVPPSNCADLPEVQTYQRREANNTRARGSFVVFTIFTRIRRWVSGMRVQRKTNGPSKGRPPADTIGKEKVVAREGKEGR